MSYPTTDDVNLHAEPPWPVPGHDTARRRKTELPRILLVEDDASTADVMQRLLTRQGYDVRSAACYKEALHTATEWFPDVLISDIVLPEKDGFQVIKTMRAAYPGLKGIAVSGYASPEDVARSRDAGFSEHFAKPVDIAQLTDAIRHLLVE